MPGETSNIGKMAEKLSNDLLKFFRWKIVGPTNENFSCCKPNKHASEKNQAHTHPVDVVFKYFDPYLNKYILLNTDLKSYKAGSITSHSVRTALVSLASSIDCARTSKQWKTRYQLTDEDSEIRGLLFVYNHCGEYDKDFFNFFRKGKDLKRKIVSIENLPISSGQQIHIIDPNIINFMTSLVNDINVLKGKFLFPSNDKYYFFYPTLQLHTLYVKKSERPLTIDMLTSPFFVIQHDEVMGLNDENEVVSKFGKGHIVYFNSKGSSPEEFIYLFDFLTKNQIFENESELRVRVPFRNYCPDILSNFEKAKNMYAAARNYDDYKQNQLKTIELTIVQTVQTLLSSINVGWER